MSKKRRDATGQFPKNTILHSANSYLKVHKDNDMMRRGNFHSYARVAREVDVTRLHRRINWLRRLYCTLVGC